mmetsp:Transcript_5994/g.14183  ORF Transcript_5994/g.14183 Transcript_5994/m.14183 type:complete len:330 (-) Transcript_5994:830-1819(-)
MKQRRDLLVEFFVIVNITNLSKHSISEWTPVWWNRIQKSLDVGGSNNVDTTSIQVGSEGQSSQTSISSIGPAIDTDLVLVRNSLVNRPLDRVCQVMLHISDAPLLVTLVQKGLAVSSRAAIVHLQSGVSTVGKPLCLWVEPPTVSCPWSSVYQQNEWSRFIGLGLCQICYQLHSISSGNANIFHWSQLVVKKVWFADKQGSCCFFSLIIHKILSGSIGSDKPNDPKLFVIGSTQADNFSALGCHGFQHLVVVLKLLVPELALGAGIVVGDSSDFLGIFIQSDTTAVTFIGSKDFFQGFTRLEINLEQSCGLSAQAALQIGSLAIGTPID